MQIKYNDTPEKRHLVRDFNPKLEEPHNPLECPELYKTFGFKKDNANIPYFNDFEGLDGIVQSSTLFGILKIMCEDIVPATHVIQAGHLKAY